MILGSETQERRAKVESINTFCSFGYPAVASITIITFSTSPNLLKCLGSASQAVARWIGKFKATYLKNLSRYFVHNWLIIRTTQLYCKQRWYNNFVPLKKMVQEPKSSNGRALEYEPANERQHIQFP